MKHIFIYTNKFKDKDGLVTNEIARLLRKRNVCCSSTSIDIYERKKIPPNENNGISIPKDVDCIMVIGGDGTLLQAARDTITLGLPLIGINLGTLGFLAEIDRSNLEEAIDMILAEKFSIEKRMLLEGKIMQQEECTFGAWALNDIVLSRTSMQMIRFKIFVNGQFLYTYSGDGMIVTTPTGSTGYNLSAGGPIVEPSANLMMLTPICPHTLNQRSIILSPEDIITIEIPKAKEGKEQLVEINLDGSHQLALQEGDYIEIKKAEKAVKIMKLSQKSFLQILHKKMSEA